MSTINLDDIVVNLDGVVPTGDRLFGTEALQVVQDRLGGRSMQSQQLAKVMIELLPVEYHTQQTLQTLNYFPIINQLMGGAQTVTEDVRVEWDSGTKSITIVPDVLINARSTEYQFNWGNAAQTLQTKFPNVDYDLIKEYVTDEYMAQVSDPNASLIPTLESFNTPEGELISPASENFNQYIESKGYEPRTPYGPTTPNSGTTQFDTSGQNVGQPAPTNVVTQPGQTAGTPTTSVAPTPVAPSTTTAGSSGPPPPVAPPTSTQTTVVDPDVAAQAQADDPDVAAQAQADASSITGILPDFDWSQFSSDDVKWLVRANSTFDGAMNELVARAQSEIDLIANNVIAPTYLTDDQGNQIAPSLSNILGFATFDLIDEGMRQQFQDPSLLVDENLSLTELINLPYYLNDLGIAEIAKKLDYAGYFEQVGGYPQRLTEPSDPYFVAAWKQMLRDAIAEDRTIAESVTLRADERLTDARDRLGEQADTDRLLLNQIGYSVLGRNLYETELEQVLSMVNSFSDEQLSQFAATGQRPEDLTTAGIRAVQEVAAEDLALLREGSRYTNIMGWSFNRPTSSSGEIFPMIGAEQ